MVNIVVRQDFGLEFLAKAKPLRPRPAYYKAKAKDYITELTPALVKAVFTICTAGLSAC